MASRYLASTGTGPDYLRDEIHVSLTENAPDVRIFLFTSQLHALSREADESISKTLRRIELTLQKALVGKGKKNAKHAKGKQGEDDKGDDPEAGVVVLALPSRTTVDMADLTNRTGWQDNTIIKFPGIFRADTGTGTEPRSLELVVRMDPPEVASLSTVPGRAPMVGFPILPYATLKNGNAVEVLWFMQFPLGTPSAATAAATAAAGLDSKKGPVKATAAATAGDEWCLVGREPMFIPSDAHIGAKLKVYCTPLNASTGSRGRSAVSYVSGAIQMFAGEETELITHSRRAFIGIPRGVAEAADHRAALPALSAASALADRDHLPPPLPPTATGRHFAPLFGPGSDACASSMPSRLQAEPATNYVNSAADRCPPEHCVSNTSDYHMGRVRLLHCDTDYVHTPRDGTDGGSEPALRRGASDFRLVCYNILADPFATSEQAVRDLFRYCDARHLQADYRLQLILRELGAYDADVYLLQECDERVGKAQLQVLNALAQTGKTDNDGNDGNGGKDGKDGDRRYEIFYTGKDSNVPEGCCTVVNTAVFAVAGRVDVHIGSALQGYLEHAALLPGEEEAGREERRTLHAYLRAHPACWDVLTTKLGQIGQVTVLRRKVPPVAASHSGSGSSSGSSSGSGSGAHFVCVGNTHLFYHPNAGYARLLQAHVLCLVLHSLAAHVQRCGGGVASFCFPGVTVHGPGPDYTCAYATDSEGEGVGVGVGVDALSPHTVSVVLAGDLNSTLETAAVEYLLSDGVTAEHEVWDSLDHFRWGRRGEAGAGAGAEDGAVSVSIPSSPTAAAGSGAGTGVDGGKDTGKSDSGSGSAADETVQQLAQSLGAASLTLTLSLSLVDDSGAAAPCRRPLLRNPFARAKANAHESDQPQPQPSWDGLFSASGFPQFTNFTADFKDVLDYVFVARTRAAGVGEGGGGGAEGGGPLRALRVLRTAPFPTEGELAARVGLPSATFPSDHIALGVDLGF